MIRTAVCALPLLAALVMLGGCATPASGLKKGDAPPLNPISHYSMQTETAPEEIALGQHADGLSERQRAALVDYARGYIEAGGEQVVVRVPAGSGPTAQHMALGAKAVLESAGLRDHEVRVDVYPADRVDGPIRLAYDRVRAKPLACGKSWNDLTASRDNQTQSNFGCALTSNMAMQVADPRDIQRPHGADPADAGRRTTVLEKYRKGEITAAVADDKAKGNVTQEIQ